MNKVNKTALAISTLCTIQSVAAAEQPNILAIWADDLGFYNTSAYNRGMMGYQTPNIDRIANDGAIFTDMYAQQSCTAGRAAFVTGEHPFRTGLLTIGMPGSSHGIPDWAPTIGDVLKDQGYVTAQFGKNHLGDQDKHLPTKHGFDEFYGNLYHLNAEEEPETYFYPKDPEFRKNYGPRGVIKSTADGSIEDTGPLTRARMESIDEDFTEAAITFMKKAVKDDKPFFVWYNSTRMHVWTRLNDHYDGITGQGVYADGMRQLDDNVGMLLDTLDELKIADNTIVIFSTDNGAEKFTWPDGGTSPFHGEKGTTYEGGMRVPQIVRWPGVIEAGSAENALMSQEDWLPTLAAAAGNHTIVEDLKKGAEINNKHTRVHLDGFNFLPYFKGKDTNSPRESIFYFSANGELNAIRWNDWKLTFAMMNGDMQSAVRDVPAWASITNLRMDPFETAAKESGLYTRWMIDNMWLFVPISKEITAFLDTIDQYPAQKGQGYSAASVNYNSLKLQKLVNQLQNSDMH